MAAEEARHQARLDSMAKAEKAMAEAMAAREAQLLDSLTQAKGTVLNPSKLGGLFTTKLESKYYIVVGAFRARANAERKLTQCNSAGYTATIISFRNGLLAVAICPSNNLEETLKTLKQLRGTEVCPQDGWILMNI
jgi:cell division protein FtsN